MLFRNLLKDLKRSVFTLRNKVLQGFFTNTYNKPYPIEFFTLKVFQKTLHAVKNPLGFFKNLVGVFHSVKNPIGWVGFVMCW
jgi:hypothetical protein